MRFRLLSAIFAALALMLLPVAMGGAGQAMAHGSIASAPADSGHCHGEGKADDQGKGSMSTACANACAGVAPALPQPVEALPHARIAATARPAPHLSGVHLPIATPPPRLSPETLL